MKRDHLLGFFQPNEFTQEGWIVPTFKGLGASWRHVREAEAQNKKNWASPKETPAEFHFRTSQEFDKDLKAETHARNYGKAPSKVLPWAPAAGTRVFFHENHACKGIVRRMLPADPLCLVQYIDRGQLRTAYVRPESLAPDPSEGWIPWDPESATEPPQCTQIPPGTLKHRLETPIEVRYNQFSHFTGSDVEKREWGLSPHYWKGDPSSQRQIIIAYRIAS